MYIIPRSVFFALDFKIWKMGEVKFGTDGWRAIIGRDYTIANVRRISEATGKWMLSKGMSNVVIGFDCRFGGRMFCEETACVLVALGINVLMAEEFVSTPMVSLGVLRHKADMGIVITASHNPPSYNGYKLKSAYGGPTVPDDIKAVEELIPELATVDTTDFTTYVMKGKIQYVDLETEYIRHVQSNFDLETITNSNITLAYDAMYGAGQNVIRKLFPDARLLHCDNNPSFRGQAPEPIARNLKELSSLIAGDDDITLGLANDGDADRVGMFDENGVFVDSHHILLLLLYYAREFKKLDGKVVITFSVTDKMKKLAEQYGLDIEVTKIGFKHIAEIMTQETVLVGGEESGGLAVSGHIPERDGIWVGLLIMEFMARTGKSIRELISEVYEKVGEFAFDRDDLHITEEKKQSIISRCSNGEITKIGDREVIKTETIDGFKFYLSEDEWVMIRPSGTEPVLRVYAQAQNDTRVSEVLRSTHETLRR